MISLLEIGKVAFAFAKWKLEIPDKGGLYGPKS